MEFKRPKVFIDTSALVAGLASETGAAREALRLAEAGIVILYLSNQVLVEADRTFTNKLPSLVFEYRAYMRDLAANLVEDPSSERVKDAMQYISAKDAPILAAAAEAEVDYLITWDRKHFLSKKAGEYSSIKIVTPGEFIEKFKSGSL
jgi:predicted nucleic acid-binding protein